MGIQDNIFDVEAALEGKQELHQFDEIMDRFYEMERELETLRRLRFCVSELKNAVNEVENKMRGSV